MKFNWVMTVDPNFDTNEILSPENCAQQGYSKLFALHFEYPFPA